jgi:hypothetical protein
MKVHELINILNHVDGNSVVDHRDIYISTPAGDALPSVRETATVLGVAITDPGDDDDGGEDTGVTPAPVAGVDADGGAVIPDSTG